MVKLSVEGDAMVSLMQDGEMLEEMDGHVYVDLGGNSSARLEAMSHSDPDLMDGDMAFKAWKLMEGGRTAPISARATGSRSMSAARRRCRLCRCLDSSFWPCS